jgi:tRNA 2-thiouridine synthesizing protein A
VRPNSQPVAPIEVDARGLRCPLPVIRLAETAKGKPPGTSIVVLADDPAARYDIPAWCRMRHHELAEMTELPSRPPSGETSNVPTSPDTGGLPAEGGHRGYVRFQVLLQA